MQKGQAFIWIIVGSLVIAIAGGAYYLGRPTSPKPSSNPVITSQTPQPTLNPDASPAPTGVGETSTWKTYQGKYFSFQYPSAWPTAYSTTGQSEISGYKKVLEITGTRISPNAVFEVTYRNISYEENKPTTRIDKSQKLLVNRKEATLFQLDGSGEVLPKGYSIITIVVRGSDNTSYTITFNGDRKDITDSLINRILSTFKFTQ